MCLLHMERSSAHASTPSASQVELILTIRTNAHKLCEELRSLVARRGIWRALLHDKALLKDLTALDIEHVVAAVRRYKGSKSVNEALAQIETQLNELAKVGTGRPFAEEDERVARAVLGLLQRGSSKILHPSQREFDWWRIALDPARLRASILLFSSALLNWRHHRELCYLNTCRKPNRRCLLLSQIRRG